MKKLLLPFCLSFLQTALAFAAPPSPNEAPDTMTAEARRRFDEGKKANTEGDFERARVAYMQTYLLNQSPVVLRNLGSSEIRSGHLVSGARHLSNYLHGEAAATENAEQRAAAVKLLTEAEGKIGRVQVDVDLPGVEVRIDGELIGRSPIPDPSYVEPGARLITARKDDREVSKELAVSPGEVAHVTLALKPLSGSLDQPTPQSVPMVGSGLHSGISPTRKQSVLPLVLLIAAGTATAASATAWYISAHNESSADADVNRLLGEARSRFGDSPCASRAAASSPVCADLDQRHADGESASKWKNYSRLATGVFALGTIAAVGYWWSARGSNTEPQRATAMQITGWLLPHSGGLSATGSF